MRISGGLDSDAGCELSSETAAALAELLALFDELAQRGRRLRAAGSAPKRPLPLAEPES